MTFSGILMQKRQNFRKNAANCPLHANEKLTAKPSMPFDSKVKFQMSL